MIMFFGKYLCFIFGDGDLFSKHHIQSHIHSVAKSVLCLTYLFIPFFENQSAMVRNCAKCRDLMGKHMIFWNLRHVCKDIINPLYMGNP